MQTPRPSLPEMEQIEIAYTQFIGIVGEHFWFCEKAADPSGFCSCGMDILRWSVHVTANERVTELNVLEKLLGSGRE